MVDTEIEPVCVSLGDAVLVSVDELVLVSSIVGVRDCVSLSDRDSDAVDVPVLLADTVELCTRDVE